MLHAPAQMQGSVMPQAYFSSGPSLTRIERPRCSHCTSRMMLARISPGPTGFEHRLFECPKCGSVQNEVVAGDPMQSASAGWLAGELGTDVRPKGTEHFRRSIVL